MAVWVHSSLARPDCGVCSLDGSYFFFFFKGRSQLQHEVIQTRLQKETAGQSTENKEQRTKDKKTGETGEGKQRNLN